MDLDHRTDDCAGEWQPKRRGTFIHWRCSECDTLYYDAPDVRYAALRENAMGKMLEILAVMGQRKKDAGEERPEGWEG